MNWLVANTPPTRIWINEALLTKTEENNWLEGTIHAVHSIPGQMALFSVLLSNGANISRVPLHWLTTRPSLELLPATEAQLWNNLSYGVVCFVYQHLSGVHTSVKLRSGSVQSGTYLFTIQYWGSRYADGAGPLGNKDCHIIALDSGHLIGYPNNRISWNEPAATTPFSWCGPVPKYKVINEIFSCEKTIEAENDEYHY